MRDLLPSGTWTRLLASDASTAFTGHVNRWSPQWRYNPNNPTEVEAGRFLSAIDVIWKWLGDNA
jgi:hypothetical protein